MKIRTLASFALAGIVWFASGDTPASPPSHPQVRQHHTTTITPAFFEFDPPKGIFGFFCILDDQRYDTWIQEHRVWVPAKIYETDIHGMYAFMIYTTDPDAQIEAYEVGKRGLKSIHLEIMEVTHDHKVVFINTANEKKAYHRVLLLLTSPHQERKFYISIFGDPDSGFD